MTVTTPVTGVSLDQATLTLNVGDSSVLVAEVEPASASNRALSWESSDEAVATVDENGNIEALAAGTATITVTTKSGGFTDTCEVTVS